MSQKYILKDGEPVPCDDLREWGEWIEDSPARMVGCDHIDGHAISTVFLGIDHQHGDGSPLLFETMIFKAGSDLDHWQDRCGTLEGAREMHARAVALVKPTKAGTES